MLMYVFFVEEKSWNVCHRALNHSTPTVEPSGGDNHLLENRLLKPFLCGNWNLVDT